jgi:hypothetical protein
LKDGSGIAEWQSSVGKSVCKHKSVKAKEALHQFRELAQKEENDFRRTARFEERSG